MGKSLYRAFIAVFIGIYYFSAVYDIVLRFMECHIPRSQYLEFLYDGYQNVTYCEGTDTEVRKILYFKDLIDPCIRIIVVYLYIKHKCGIYCFLVQLFRDIFQTTMLGITQIGSHINRLYYYPRLIQLMKYFDSNSSNVLQPVLLFCIYVVILIIVVAMILQCYAYGEELFFSKYEVDNDDEDTNSTIDPPPPSYDEAIVINNDDDNNNTVINYRSTVV